jgi:hypothetical protein
MPEVYDMIMDAINNKRHILAVYEGYPREMCPHALGWKHGRRQALFYQFGGSSRSGLAPAGSSANWRCIPIDNLSEVSVRDGPWYTAGDHTRRQTCVDRVEHEVTY